MKARFFAAIALTLALTACNNDEMDNPLADGPVPLGVTTDISSMAIRATANGNSAVFDNGDKINVIAEGASAYTYVLNQNGEWKSDSPYYFQNRSDVSFQAWYAIVTPIDNTISIDTRTQTLTDGWNNHDILVTPKVSAGIERDVTNVSFTGDNAFRHIMSQIAFQFKAGDGISDLTKLSGYTLKNLTIDATFNTQTCVLANGSTTADITIPISGASGQDYTCTPIILLPQTVTNGKLNLVVHFNGTTYKADLSLTELAAGKLHVFPVTIKNTELEIGTAEIKDWVTSTEQSGNATLQ